MKAYMEQETGELLQCNICCEFFNGTAILTVEEEEKEISEVVCMSCGESQSLASKVKEE